MKRIVLSLIICISAYAANGQNYQAISSNSYQSDGGPAYSTTYRFDDGTTTNFIYRPQHYCQMCNGTGIYRCPGCNGSGYLYLYSGTYACLACQGNGTHRCNCCNGAGKHVETWIVDKGYSSKAAAVTALKTMARKHAKRNNHNHIGGNNNGYGSGGYGVSPYNSTGSGGSIAGGSSSRKEQCRTCSGTGTCQSCYGLGVITSGFAENGQTMCPNCDVKYVSQDKGNGKCHWCHGTGYRN